MEIKEASTKIEKKLFSRLSELGHEQVIFCHDEPTGLKAIIGIHNTILGPALGGTRMWNYSTEDEALEDVLRLSRGMTFKAAVAGLNIGGGKAVIIGDADTLKTEVFMRRFGRFIDSLGGRYITAEDVNMKTRDMEFIAMETKHVTGLPESMGGGGDPSPVTAYGTYVGIKAAVNNVFGSQSLAGKKIAVQGVGQVGSFLVDHLSKENADIYISDISEYKIKQITKKHKVEVISDAELFELDMDIYAPCALGATLNDESISKIQATIVAGAANNQLKDEIKHGYMLMDKGITYVPDFVINAGGLINVYLEYLGDYNRERAYAMAEQIYDSCLLVLNHADQNNTSPQEAAMKIANDRIQKISQVKLTY